MSISRLDASQIVGIDAIRFFAACSVMLFHLCYHIWAGGAETTTPFAAKHAVEFRELSVFRFGAVGVHIFFVISGFVIAYSAARSTAYGFFRSRVLRLMPAIWIVAPITFAVFILIEFAPPPDLLGMLLRSVLLSPSGPWIDSVYWTLPVEVAFYAIVLLLLAMSQFSRIELIMAAIGLASSGIWIANALGFDLMLGLHVAAPLLTDVVAHLLLVKYGCFFAFGVFLWLILLDRMSLTRCLVAGCLGAGCLVHIQTQMHSLGACAVWIVAMVGIALSVRFNSVLVSRAEFARTARVLGITTYPLYLLHDGVGAALIGYLHRSGINRFAALGASVIIVTSASVAIAVVVEPVVRDWLRRSMDGAGRMLGHG